MKTVVFDDFDVFQNINCWYVDQTLRTFQIHDLLCGLLSTHIILKKKKKQQQSRAVEAE